jgi:hypothetical protein
MGRSDDGPVKLYASPSQRDEDDVPLPEDDVSSHVTVEQIWVEVE